MSFFRTALEDWSNSFCALGSEHNVLIYLYHILLGIIFACGLKTAFFALTIAALKSECFVKHNLFSPWYFYSERISHYFSMFLKSKLIISCSSLLSLGWEPWTVRSTEVCLPEVILTL